MSVLDDDDDFEPVEGISEQMPDHQPFTAGMVDLVVEYRYICSSVHSSFGQFTLEFSLAGFILLPLEL